jgi:hypothetical protein
MISCKALTVLLIRKIQLCSSNSRSELRFSLPILIHCLSLATCRKCFRLQYPKFAITVHATFPEPSFISPAHSRRENNRTVPTDCREFGCRQFLISLKRISGL